MTLDIASVAQAARWLQTSVTGVRDLAEKLGIKPTVRVNGNDHFDTADIHRMAEALKEKAHGQDASTKRS